MQWLGLGATGHLSRAVYEEVNRFLVGLMLPSSGEVEGEFDVVAGYNPHISQPVSSCPADSQPLRDLGELVIMG